MKDTIVDDVKHEDSINDQENVNNTTRKENMIPINERPQVGCEIDFFYSSKTNFSEGKDLLKIYILILLWICPEVVKRVIDMLKKENKRLKR